MEIGRPEFCKEIQRQQRYKDSFKVLLGFSGITLIAEPERVESTESESKSYQSKSLFHTFCVPLLTFLPKTRL